MIYANILIDVSQNKYIKLEPIDDDGSKFKTKKISEYKQIGY